MRLLFTLPKDKSDSLCVSRRRRPSSLSGRGTRGSFSSRRSEPWPSVSTPRPSPSTGPVKHFKYCLTMIVYIQFQSQSLLCIKRFMLKAMRLYVKTETSAKQKDSCESRNVRRVCHLIYSLKKRFQNKNRTGNIFMPRTPQLWTNKHHFLLEKYCFVKIHISRSVICALLLVDLRWYCRVARIYFNSLK